MNFRGMDLDQIEALTNQLATQAGLISGVVATVDESVGALTSVWFGEDLNHFHSGWAGAQRGQANNAAVDVHAAVANLRSQIAQQRQVSDGTSEDRSGYGAGLLAPHPPGAGPIKPTKFKPGFAADPRSKPWVLNMALLSDAQENGGKNVPGGFTKLQELHGEEDFHATVYSYLDGDGKTRYVIAYEGTKLGSSLVADAENFANGQSLYYRQAVDLAVGLEKDHPGMVSFTGHSLGGGCAQAASVATGEPAYAFNTAQMGTGTEEYARNSALALGHRPSSDQIQQYNTSRDFVHDKGTSHGTAHTVESDDSAWDPWRMNEHNMGNVIHSIEHDTSGNFN